MLIPVGLKGKERAAYVKRHKHQVGKNVNKGPRAKLRTVGGDKALTKKEVDDAKAT